MSTSTAYVSRTEGPWTYERATWRSTFVLSNSETGEVLDTRTTTFPDARRWLYEHNRSQRPAVQYSIVSGPQRARAGHQRHTVHDFA